jgi:hypothetical protein
MKKLFGVLWFCSHFADKAQSIKLSKKVLKRILSADIWKAEELSSWN